MANRRRLRRHRQREDQGAPAVSTPPAAELAPAEAIPTDLIHRGRPVVWFDGVLYSDGKPIGRRPRP